MDLATIERSNIAPEKKSQFRKWYDNARSGGFERASSHLGATGHAFRQVGETAVAGALLGYVKAVRQDGLDAGKHKIPLDAVGGAVLIAGSIALGTTHEASTDLRNVGSFGVGVAAMRKTEDFIVSRRVAGGAPVAGAPAAGTPAAHGDIGEDPIVAAARAL